MPQQSCPWCSHCGPRYPEGTPKSDIPSAHSDGSQCICRHITCHSRASAVLHGGRYYAPELKRWVCMGGCEPVESPLPTRRRSGSKGRRHYRRCLHGVENSARCSLGYCRHDRW